MGSREAMEEEIEPYSTQQVFWTPNQLGVVNPDGIEFICNTLINAEKPLVLTGYTGRDHDEVHALVELADTVRGLRVLDTAGADMCFPADHPAWLGLAYGEHEAIREADVILVLESDVRLPRDGIVGENN